LPRRRAPRLRDRRHHGGRPGPQPRVRQLRPPRVRRGRLPGGTRHRGPAGTDPGGCPMSLLERVQRGRTPRPPRVLVHRTEGIGKSTFASQAPRPVFIQTEDGLDEIPCDRFPLATSYAEVLAALAELRAEPHEYETVVVDSLDWLESLAWDRVCQESGAATI